jgi:hypothetical protein
MGYKPTITKIDAFDATKGTTVYFGWRGNAAFANELIIKNSETLDEVYRYRTERQMGLYHEMNIAEGATESFINGKLYQATLIVYDKDGVASNESDPITFWCFSTPTFEITNDFVNTGILTMSSVYLTFKYKQDENETLNEYTVKLYDSNNQLLHQSKTYNTSISDGELVYRIEGLQNTHEYKVCVEGITIHGMEVNTDYVLFSIKYDKMGAGALVNLKDIGDGKISIGSNFKILDATAYPDIPKYIDNEEVDLRKSGSYVEFDDGFIVDGNYECKVAFRAPSIGNLYTMKNVQGDTIRLSYEYYDIYNEENNDIVKKYYFRLNVSGKNTNINIVSDMFDKLTYGQKVVALIQHKNGYYNLKLKISKDSTDTVAITYHLDNDQEVYTEYVNVGDPMVNTSFSIEKEGYEFVGWREDSDATSSVLSEDDVASEDMDLYAVFAKPLELTCVSYDSSEVISGNLYYNNGNITNAKITLPTGELYSEWNWRGWSDADVTDANTDIIYDNGDIISISDNATVYGLYGQDITVSYYNGGTSAETISGTRYFSASNDVLNPSFKLKQKTLDDWLTRGWSTGIDGDSDINYSDDVEFTADCNLTLYGMYQQFVNVTYYDNSTSAKTATGIRCFNSGKNKYKNPSFTLTQSSKSNWTARGWSETNMGNGTVNYNDGATFEVNSDITLYGTYYSTITLSYSGNGATSGSVSSHSGTIYWSPTGTVGATFTLKSNGFTKASTSAGVSWSWCDNQDGDDIYSTEDYGFNGWNLGAAGATVTLTSNTTATAQWKRTKLYVQHKSGIPWYHDSSASINMAGFSKVTIQTSTWTSSGCGDPDWRIYIDGAQVANLGGSQSATVNINHNGAKTVRIYHPETSYVDGYSYGKSTVMFTFT